MLQQITFQLGESDLQIGPRYQFLSMDASFEGSDDMISGISASEFKSATSGAGLTGVYDTRDHPFSPTRGMRLAGTGMVFDKALGSDFDYRLLQTSALGYVPLDDKLVLGLRLEANLTDGDVPFYGLQGISMRGIPMGRYLHDVAIVAETELRWDVTQRWSLVGFGGVGRVADSLEDIDDTEDRFSGGGGFRYLIARQYGLRLGLDVAHGPEDWAVYIGLGTGWIRE